MSSVLFKYSTQNNSSDILFAGMHITDLTHIFYDITIGSISNSFAKTAKYVGRTNFCHTGMTLYLQQLNIAMHN